MKNRFVGYAWKEHDVRSDFKMMFSELNAGFIVKQAKIMGYGNPSWMMKYLIEEVDPFEILQHKNEIRSVSTGNGRIVGGNIPINRNKFQNWRDMKNKSECTWGQVLLWYLLNGKIKDVPDHWLKKKKKDNLLRKKDSMGREFINIGTRDNPDWRLSSRNF